MLLCCSQNIKKSSRIFLFSRKTLMTSATAYFPTSTTSAKGINTFDQCIYNDHREVRDLYEKFKTSTSVEHKREFLNSLVRCVAVHSIAEELNIYPMFEKRLEHGKDTADHSRQEHQQLKDVLYQIDKMNMNDEGLSSCVDRMYSLFDSHAKEEEEQFIPELKKFLTEAEAIKLGQVFEETKMTAPTHPHPSSPDKGGILETMAGFMAKPLDALKDAGRKFAQ